MDWEPLIDTATQARRRAYAPFSRFRVGAAILADDGRIYPGCNVENRSFGGTICAERTAVTSAIVGGARSIRAVVVISDTDPPAAPCGICREVLTEFADEDVPLLLVGTEGKRREVTLGEVHPYRFEFPTRPE